MTRRRDHAPRNVKDAAYYTEKALQKGTRRNLRGTLAAVTQASLRKPKRSGRSMIFLNL